jgi:tetraacyldisaccharide 4'-kinase
MIAAPQFWRTRGWQSQLLRPASWIYGGISGARMAQMPRYRASVPVIAIGNLTAGGAGKTPTAIALTQMTTNLGFSPIVLMRGYGGTTRGPVVVDPNHESARVVGDEALMIARSGVAVIVARDRAAGAELAIACGSDLIILDDGFQSPGLAKDLAIVVVDSVYGIGNGEVIPAGPLRAPLSPQLAAADALVILSNGVAGRAADGIIARVAPDGRPIFHATVEPDDSSRDFRGRRVVAFAGIGRPEKLAEGLSARGAIVDEFIGFPDHHRYTPREARDLLARVAGTDRALVTTAKDMARLSGDPDPALTALASRAEVASVRLVFDAASDVERFVMQRLNRLGARPIELDNTLPAEATA